MALMAALKVEEPRGALATLRMLLSEWVGYRKRWAPHIGLPSGVAWLDEVRGTVDGWADGDDYDCRIHANEMRQLDEAIRNLSSNHQHALYVVYLNEAGPAVWRSSRKPMTEIRLLCDEAELLLVPALRRRGLAL